MAAESATPVSTDSSSLPGSTPDATIVAAVPAASPIPNAVPLTDARALSMMFSTSEPLLPSASSFAVAWSMLLRRPKPLVSAVPKPPIAAVPAVIPAHLIPPDAHLPSLPPRSSPVLRISSRHFDVSSRGWVGILTLLALSPVRSISRPNCSAERLALSTSSAPVGVTSRVVFSNFLTSSNRPLTPSPALSSLRVRSVSSAENTIESSPRSSAMVYAPMPWSYCQGC